MKHQHRDRYLLWGFLVAIALHTAALAAGTRLSAIRAGNGYLEEIQVFDSRAPIVVSPIELVRWEESAGTHADAAVSLPTPDQTPISSPRVRAAASETRRATAAQSSHARASGASASSSAAKQAGTRKPSDAGRTSGSSGGGGGMVDLGSPSAHGDLAGLGSGATPAGQLPGTGAGTGPGAGTGSGTGAGAGHGAAAGDGEGQTSSGATPGAGGQEAVFVSRMADRQRPEVISKGTLTYPETAREEGVEGTVQLKVLVTEEGEVASAEIVSSSGDRRLDAAARDFVRGWRYRPAVQDGKPRRVYSIATVVFELR